MEQGEIYPARAEGTLIHDMGIREPFTDDTPKKKQSDCEKKLVKKCKSHRLRINVRLWIQKDA